MTKPYQENQIVLIKELKGEHTKQERKDNTRMMFVKGNMLDIKLQDRKWHDQNEYDQNW